MPTAESSPPAATFPGGLRLHCPYWPHHAQGTREVGTPSEHVLSRGEIFPKGPGATRGLGQCVLTLWPKAVPSRLVQRYSCRPTAEDVCPRVPRTLTPVRGGCGGQALGRGGDGCVSGTSNGHRALGGHGGRVGGHGRWAAGQGRRAISPLLQTSFPGFPASSCWRDGPFWNIPSLTGRAWGSRPWGNGTRDGEQSCRWHLMEPAVGPRWEIW